MGSIRKSYLQKLMYVLEGFSSNMAEDSDKSLIFLWNEKVTRVIGTITAECLIVHSHCWGLEIFWVYQGTLDYQILLALLCLILNLSSFRFICYLSNLKGFPRQFTISTKHFCPQSTHNLKQIAN